MLDLVEIIVLLFLGKTLKSNSASLHPGIYMDAGKLLIALSFLSIDSQPDHEDTDGIIVAIAISGTVLCVSLICAFAMVLYRYTHICKSR